jgi:predicted transcriptional regulator
MKRTTIKLPDDLDAHLRHEAERRGITIAEVAREAIAEHLGVAPGRTLRAAAAGHSGRHDVSERIEDILREEVGR